MVTNSKEYAEKYYRQNKSKIRESQKKIIRCTACDCELTNGFISRHNKTAKHKVMAQLYELKNNVPHENNVLQQQ